LARLPCLVSSRNSPRKNRTTSDASYYHIWFLID
jgi:hypothetical protein